MAPEIKPEMSNPHSPPPAPHREAQNRRRNAIPVLYTSGTHYEIGYDVGHTFRGIITEFLDSFTLFQTRLLPAYATPKGREAYETSLKAAEENFPHYVREVRGTADGAQVPFHHLMLLNLGRLVTTAAGSPKGKCKPPHGCSSVCCNYDGQVLLGHTEDALSDVLNHIYIVSAQVSEDEPQGRYNTTSEGFTALCYAGYLPGFCMGYNHHGFVFSINVLFPSQVQPGKTASYFLTRALLGAANFEEAQTILRDRGVGAADGFSVNMSFSQQEGDILFHNAEIGPAVDSAESQLSVLTLSPGEHFIHTNKYLRLELPEDRQYEHVSSDHRLARADECSPPDCKAALLELLSDTHDLEYPFFREGQEDVMTVTLGIFDLTEKTWTFWMKNPRTTEPLVTLPLVFKWTK